MLANWTYSLVVLILTTLSGFADGYGFSNASKLWNPTFSWLTFFHSAIGFFVGILLFWCSVRYMNLLGITSAEVQSLLWFASTIVSVAIFTGSFFNWTVADKIIALVVVCGISLLIVRVGAL